MAERSVACVVDVASRAAECSGEVFDLTVRRETQDGVDYVRLVTDPASFVMPLSAFRFVAAWANPPQWQALEEAPKDGSVVMYIYKLDGAYGVSTMQWMETFSAEPADESAPCWWDVQLDDEAYKPLGWMRGPVVPNRPTETIAPSHNAGEGQ